MVKWCPELLQLLSDGGVGLFRNVYSVLLPWLLLVVENVCMLKIVMKMRMTIVKNRLRLELST